MPNSSGFSVDSILSSSSPSSSAGIALTPSTSANNKEKDVLHALFSLSVPLNKEFIGSSATSFGISDDGCPSAAPAQQSTTSAVDDADPLPLTNDLLFSQWTMQYIHQMFTATSSNNNEGEETKFGVEETGSKEGTSQSQMPTIAVNPMFLNPPLAFSTKNGFPLFQQMQKTKRVRTAFSPAQLVQLEKAFGHSQYLVGSDRKQLAKQLALSETQVKVWFQNRRTKSKRVDFFGTRCEDGQLSPLDFNEEGGESECEKPRRKTAK